MSIIYNSNNKNYINTKQFNISLTLRNYIDKLLKTQAENKDFAKWNLKEPLPKLPVPDLSLSIQKYLRCIRPIIDSESYKKTESIANEFLATSGIGEKLQAILEEKAEHEDNWAYHWWLDDMYLLNQIPLPINSNPAMIFPIENFPDENAQLRFAARLISGIMDYKLVIDGRELPVDRCTSREKGQPLCMEQYYRLFSSYRLPGLHKDKLVDSNNNLALEPEHVIVLSRNQMFVLDVIVNFTRLSEDQLFQQLKRIKIQSEEEENTLVSYANVGFLTSLPRNEWAQAREELIRESTNRDCLDMIERCIFIICLDKKVESFNSNSIQPARDESNEELMQKETMERAAYQMLHGCGSINNSGNRWFDKTMQFIISEDGCYGINFEHSPAEGIVIIELSEHLFRYMEEKRKQKLNRMASICELPMPRKLRWKISDPTNKNIEKAKLGFEKTIDDLDFSLLKYTKFGKEFPKKVKVSPDSFIQLSMQLAYYKIYNKLVSTYESASTRRFRLGRVDNIRANSCETLEWVESMRADSTKNKQEKLELFKKAVQCQTDIMINSILGKGMDCHLLALKQISIEQGYEIPALFTDESYKISNYFQLSTSQIPTSTEDSFMCYGPVVPDGYGCSYNPKSDFILFAISSFKSCSLTSTKIFSESLKTSLNEMYDLCSDPV